MPFPLHSTMYTKIRQTIAPAGNLYTVQQQLQRDETEKGLAMVVQ